MGSSSSHLSRSSPSPTQGGGSIISRSLKSKKSKAKARANKSTTNEEDAILAGGGNDNPSDSSSESSTSSKPNKTDETTSKTSADDNDEINTADSSFDSTSNNAETAGLKVRLDFDASSPALARTTHTNTNAKAESFATPRSNAATSSSSSLSGDKIKTKSDASASASASGDELLFSPPPTSNSHSHLSSHSSSSSSSSSNAASSSNEETNPSKAHISATFSPYKRPSPSRKRNKITTTPTSASASTSASAFTSSSASYTSSIANRLRSRLTSGSPLSSTPSVTSTSAHTASLSTSSSSDASSSTGAPQEPRSNNLRSSENTQVADINSSYSSSSSSLLKPPQLPLNLKPKPTNIPTLTTLTPSGTYTYSTCPTKTINTTLVYVVDEAKGVFVFDLLTSSECESIISRSESHVDEGKRKFIAAGGEKSSQSSENIPQPSQWRKLYTYTSQDLPMSDVPEFAIVKTSLMERITKVIAGFYNEVKNASAAAGKSVKTKDYDWSALKPRSWKEPHLLKYDFSNAAKPQLGVESHYDGCNVTWNLMLSKSSDYTGGGTYVRCLQRTIRLEQGQVLVHPGDLFHSGVNIGNGRRYLVVCFADGFDPGILDDSVAKDDRKEFMGRVVSFGLGCGGEGGGEEGEGELG